MCVCVCGWVSSSFFCTWVWPSPIHTHRHEAYGRERSSLLDRSLVGCWVTTTKKGRRGRGRGSRGGRVLHTSKSATSVDSTPINPWLIVQSIMCMVISSLVDKTFFPNELEDWPIESSTHPPLFPFSPHLPTVLFLPAPPPSLHASGGAALIRSLLARSIRKKFCNP